jgi:hypothetical protein
MVRDNAGNHISFIGTSEPHQGNTQLKAKAYRKTFTLQQNILTKDKHVPNENKRD